jgi:recombination protein RecT
MEQVKRRFAEALGGNPGQFIATIIVASIINPDIQNCEPNSVINAALQAAILNLSISPSLGQAAIIPYDTRSGKKAQFQVMKAGLVQLCLRTNKYRHLHVAPLYEGEQIIEDRFTGKITLAGNRTGEKIIGRVAYLQLNNGFEKYLYMSDEQILEHAQKYSKSWDGGKKCFRYGSAWANSWDKMCEKTVLKLLIKNYGYLSPEIRGAISNENETGEVEHIDIPFEDVTDEPASPEPGQPQSDTSPISQSKPVEQLTEDEIMTQMGFSA